MGVSLNAVQLFHLHSAELADLPQVIPSQIHQHVVLRQFLIIRQQLRLQRLVFPFGPSPGTGSCQGEGVQHPILQLHQCFRRSTGDLHVHAGKVKHIGGGIQRPQDTVGVQQAACIRSSQPIGQNNLKNIPLPDVMLCLLHHVTVAFPVKQGRKVSQQMPGRFLLGDAGLLQRRHALQFHHCLVVPGFRILQRHIGNEDDLLPEVVKGDYLIEQHQIHVLEILRVPGLQIHGRLCILQKVVGEVSHQSAGKGRQLRQSGAFILCKDLSQLLCRMLRFDPHISDLHVPA